MIIGINGYAQSGKDTIGAIIQYLQCTNVGNLTIEDVVEDYKEHEWWLEEQSNWEIRKFAGKLKDIAEHLTGIPLEKFEDPEFKKTNLNPEWSTHHMPMTVREFLQKLGTDALRNGLHTDVWVNALMADYNLIEYGDDEQGHYPNWVVTDTRFVNEAHAIKEKKGIIIRVDRPGVEPINNHPSETELDNWNFDYRIVNVSGIYELKETVKDILKHAKIL